MQPATSESEGKVLQITGSIWQTDVYVYIYVYIYISEITVATIA
jgi:hypothetical protein